MALIWAVLGLAAFYLSIRIIYNLYFHPCAHLPGPRICAITRMPWAWANLNGNGIFWTKAQHDKYGHIVRVAPNELSFSHADAWKQLYGRRTVDGQSIALAKDRDFYKAFAGPAGPNIFTLPTLSDDHARVRGVMNRFFAAKAFREHEPLIQEYTNNALANMAKHASAEGKINMQSVFNFLSIDIMSAFMFRDSWDLLVKDEYNAWLKTFFGNLKAMAMSSVLVFFPVILNIVEKYFPKKFQNVQDQHYAFIYGEMDKRIDGGALRKDLWWYQLEGAELSRNELRSNAALIIMAGSDTSAVCMVGTTYMLLRDRACWEKATAEIRGAFKTLDDITFESLVKLPYLTAAIQESLRLYPPSPTGLPRLAPKEGVDICGSWIPGNTTVHSCHYSSARSPDNFYLPDSFIPERWLDDKRFVGDKKEASQPFSYGPRSCPAQVMAWHEVRMAVAKAIWCFDMSLVNENEDWMHQKAFIAWEKLPLWVSLKKVDGVEI